MVAPVKPRGNRQSWAAYCHLRRGTRQPAENKPPPGTTASVVIFPGIRYERPKSSGPVDDAAGTNRSDTRRDKPSPRH